MNVKERILELLHYFQQHFNQIGNYLIDNERIEYLPRIQEQQTYIMQTIENVNNLNPNIEEDMIELVRIHGEILYRYY